MLNYIKGSFLEEMPTFSALSSKQPYGMWNFTGGCDEV